MQRKDVNIINKIISEIQIGQEMLGEISLGDFLENEILKRAVSMTILNIGELVKNLTPEVRMQYSEIPWKSVAGMRDMAAHKYQTLRMEDVYNTAKIDFPCLLEQLNALLTELDDGECGER